MTIDHTPFGLGGDGAGGSVFGEIEHYDFVDSEALDSGDYDPVTGDLTLDFSDGDEIQLSGVSREVFAALKASPSPGTYFNLAMRGRY